MNASGHVRIWDVFAGKGNTEALQHNHDVLALAYRPDGKQLAAATLNGDITLWDPNEGVLQVGGDDWWAAVGMGGVGPGGSPEGQ